MERLWPDVHLQELRARMEVSQPAFHCATFDLRRLSSRKGLSCQRTDRIGNG